MFLARSTAQHNQDRLYKRIGSGLCQASQREKAQLLVFSIGVFEMFLISRHH